MNHSNITNARRERAHLRTSRHAREQQERSVFAILRDLMPRRPLTVTEAEQLASLQATHLLRLAGIRCPATPSELIAELPRVEVIEDPDLPSSGTAVWVSGRWLLMINSSEPTARRRWSLAHELHHCLTHRHRDILFTDQPGYTAEELAEHTADAFAAALLLPKAWVRREWAAGHQRIADLSQIFEVSHEAMARRLATLGLSSAPEAKPRRRTRPTRHALNRSGATP